MKDELPLFNEFGVLIDSEVLQQCDDLSDWFKRILIAEVRKGRSLTDIRALSQFMESCISQRTAEVILTRAAKLRKDELTKKMGI